MRTSTSHNGKTLPPDVPSRRTFMTVACSCASSRMLLGATSVSTYRAQSYSLSPYSRYYLTVCVVLRFKYGAVRSERYTPVPAPHDV